MLIKSNKGFAKCKAFLLKLFIYFKGNKNINDTYRHIKEETGNKIKGGINL